MPKEMTTTDAQQIAAYMGILWVDLEPAQYAHAKDMAYRNILKQRHGSPRVQLRNAWAHAWRVALDRPEPGPRPCTGHDWQPTDNDLIDRCSLCGEERA